MTTPHVSVFVPTHRTDHLTEALQSVVAQTYQDWEVVVLRNHTDGPPPSWPTDRPRDSRIRYLTSSGVQGVGEAKARAVHHCTGQLLVELDHDDVLTDDCLQTLALAHELTPDAGLYYSETAFMNEAGEAIGQTYDPSMGWTYDPDGVPYAMPVTPHNMALIWFAPNHVRAFTRTAYDAVGGYDSTLTVLDDQDLMGRLYCHGPAVHLPLGLYRQRMHGANTQHDPDTNARIQVETWTLYERHLEAMALAQAERDGLACLDLGGAHGDADPRYARVDQHAAPGVDIVHTFPDRMPLQDQSVAVIRAHDFLEHVADKVATINELHRLLAPGGLLLSSTPSTDGRGAFQDPTHVAFYNEHSFWYYTHEQYAAFVPELTARFQVSRLRTHYPSPWHEANQVPYVQANLIALHRQDQPRDGGPIHCAIP